MSQPVKLIALLKAAPGMTREVFSRRWIEGHAPFAPRFPNLRGYRINVAIDEYQAVDGELPYDGTADLWWDSIEAMREAFDSPEARAAGADGSWTGRGDPRLTVFRPSAIGGPASLTRSAGDPSERRISRPMGWTEGGWWYVSAPRSVLVDQERIGVRVFLIVGRGATRWNRRSSARHRRRGRRRGVVPR